MFFINHVVNTTWDVLRSNITPVFHVCAKGTLMGMVSHFSQPLMHECLTIYIQVYTHCSFPHPHPHPHPHPIHTSSYLPPSNTHTKYSTVLTVCSRYFAGKGTLSEDTLSSFMQQIGMQHFILLVFVSLVWLSLIII